jgi:hypothetical protein
MLCDPSARKEKEEKEITFLFCARTPSIDESLMVAAQTLRVKESEALAKIWPRKDRKEKETGPLIWLSPTPVLAQTKELSFPATRIVGPVTGK